MLVFVYGTLKENCTNYSVLYPLLEDDEPIAIQVTTIQKYPMYKSKHYFPYLENQPGIGHYIKGELYDVPDKYEGNLDYFEGVPDLYKKGKIDVTDGKLQYKNINVYFKSEESHPFDLQQEQLMDEWVEETFDFDEYYKKITGESNE